MGIENFIAFIFTATLFILTPGIDTVFILNKSIGQGKKAGIYAALGINAGVLIHTLFAALGLSIIVAQSALAFTIIKYLGAAYLIYLGISKLIKKDDQMGFNDLTPQKAQNQRQNFVSGLITNTLNPKVALFFLAFFPQFIQPAAIQDSTPFILLGLTYAGIGLLWFIVLSFFAALFAGSIQKHPSANKWINKISGVAFILMGIKVALSKR